MHHLLVHLAPKLLSRNRIQHAAAPRLGQIAATYRHCPIARHGGGIGALRAGDRVPDVRLEQGRLYDLLDDVKAAMTGMLAPEYETVLLGRAEVRALFRISRLGTIAGCYIAEGTLQRGADMRVLRGGEVIREGKLESLRHLKDDVRELSAGFECGIGIEGYYAFEIGDIIEVYKKGVA
jgi:translation initiation factor IF-2